MHLRRADAVLLIAGSVMLALAAGLWFNNATVDVRATDLGESGPAGRVGCVLAPWDAGINGSHGPGGEHSAAFYDEVAVKCAQTNRTRYDAGIGSGALAAALFSLAAAASIRSRRPASKRAPGGQAGGLDTTM